MSLRCLGGCLLVILGVTSAAEASAQTSVRYDIICDAGSTGTRMYLFTSTFTVDSEGKETLKVATDVVGKKKPGLSAYVANPDKAVAPILELFEKVKFKIPEDMWAQTNVTVMGTAGMRSVEPHDQETIYASVRQGLVSSKGYVFNTGNQLKLHSISGTSEGTFSLLCVNFLKGRLDHRLSLTQEGAEKKLLGILDLGGSSTQIAVPPVDLKGRDVRESAVVRSYPAYGMEQMRARLDKHASEIGSTSPCYFKGYKEPSYNLEGSGEGEECREMLMEVLAKSRSDCIQNHDESKPLDEMDQECMPGLGDVSSDASKSGQQFYAVSGYLFVTDFASHWLLRDATVDDNETIAFMLKEVGNTPTLSELQLAADELCKSDWHDIERLTAAGKENGAHRYTDATKAPHRCLEINYVFSLLRNSYGFPGDQRFVTFEDEVDGNDVEWPLGALLNMRFPLVSQLEGTNDEL